MKIICIWQNNYYKKDNPEKDSNPVFYYTPETTLLLNNRTFYYPEYSSEIVCSAEAVIKICKAGKYIQKKFAHTYFNEIAFGLNFTASDIQKECIKNKHPLSMSFSFDGSTPLSQFIKKETFKNINDIEFLLKINDKNIQKFKISDTRFSIEQIISHISEFMMLKTGDMIFTGPIFKAEKINIGDKIEGFINNQSMIKFNIK